EEFVELVLEVVMVCDVAPRTGRGVAPEQLEETPFALAHRLAPGALVLPAIGSDHQLEQVEDGPVLDHQSPVHISFAEPEPGVAGDLERDLAVGEANGDVLAAAGPKD